MATKSRKGDFIFNIFFAFSSLVIIAFSICVLSGCRSPFDSTYPIFSINGSHITHIIGKNCTSCNFTNVPETYTFGFSGTCRSTNGSIWCQRKFPNTFNVPQITFADIASPDGSNSSSNHTTQYQQYASTTSINHVLVRRLSVVVAAILITSIVLNFTFIPICFMTDSSKSTWMGFRVLTPFILLDMCSHFAAVGVTYFINNKEVAGIYETAAPEMRLRDWQAKAGLGFWLLICAAVSRPLYCVLSVCLLRCTSGQADHEDRTQDSKTRSRAKGPTKLDAKTREELVAKLESVIDILEGAVHAYPNNTIIDNGCKTLLDRVRYDPDFARQLADRLAGHFNRQSANLFLGMPTEIPPQSSPPGRLLWQHEYCAHRKSQRPEIQPIDRRRGVYLIVVKESCHSPASGKELRYIGSARSAHGGAMLRVSEHIQNEADYRNGLKNSSKPKLYEEWNRLDAPCAAIYLLAEWGELPSTFYANPGRADDFDDILLGEAIWQVVLQTASERMSVFTRFLRGRLPGGEDLVNGCWEGCNVNSALEKSWAEIREGY